MPTNTPKPTAIFQTQVNADAVRACNEFRKHLITWAQNQATGQRVSASLANRKYTVDAFNAKAESYDFMAKYLEGMEIRE